MNRFNFIFFSDGNAALGEKIRNYFRKLNIDISYCSEFSKLLDLILVGKGYIVFIDRGYKDYAHIISEISRSNANVLKRIKFVYVDNDFKYYEKYTNKRNFFLIPETNMFPALYNIISFCGNTDIYSKSSVNLKLVLKSLTDILIDLGFSYKLLGFRYIKQCMIQIAKNNFILGSLYKDVYSPIAISCNTSISCIERNIRSAIIKASKTKQFKAVFNPNDEDIVISNKYFLEYLTNELAAQFGDED